MPIDSGQRPSHSPSPSRASPPGSAAMTIEQRKVVFASSLGAVFEWYDFYLFGALAAILADRFFGGLGSTSSFMFALLAFAAGFVVRPFGAVLFGRLGDQFGRKSTFILTILIMGLATFTIGVLPTHELIGMAAPVLLVLLRIAQGLALGGEYGGAAVYVAEHAPAGRRGAYTAWIQTTATLGFFLSLVVVLLTRFAVGEQAFADWGWRLPFIGSIVLLVLTVWIRLSLSESPVFRAMRDQGGLSRSPVSEALGNPRHLRTMAIALLGLVAGQAVVWYAGQFYALFFMIEVLRVDLTEATLLMAAALLIGTPMFLVSGALSDRIGRKPVLVAGFLIAALSIVPLYRAMTAVANPALVAAQAASPVVVEADPATCSFQGKLWPREADAVTGCDIARRALTELGVGYSVRDIPGPVARVAVGALRLDVPAATRQPNAYRYDELSHREVGAFRDALGRAVADQGYPPRAAPLTIGSLRWWTLVGILAALLLPVTLVYGPLAAALVEMFPTRIRYTGVSVPYHLGNGWFGGLMPSIAFAAMAHTGQLQAGLWYPVAVAALAAVVVLVGVRGGGHTASLDSVR